MHTYTRILGIDIGVPVVSITYDGTGGSKNDVVIPYLKYSRRSKSGLRRREMRQKGA